MRMKPNNECLAAHLVPSDIILLMSNNGMSMVYECDARGHEVSKIEHLINNAYQTWLISYN